ncbi:putative RNA-directed DNA polymerase, eukaryota [Tanacetum coccineum]
MISISLNSNGLGGDNKKSWINELVDRNSPSFFGVQETKLESVDQSLIRSLWPRSYAQFAFSGSVGASGGILTMWDSRVFTMEQTFCDRNFLGITGSWVGMANKVGLLNVYAPQSCLLKEALWSSIESLVTSVNVIWVVFGDFNVVRSRDESSGCRFDIGEANVFNDFISRVGFFDFPLGGRRFTRFDQEGRKSSKLDRFMVSPEFFDFWKDAHVKVLCRSFSDHCPILLKVESLNFGPKPFRVFDKWIGNADFNALVSDSWNQALPSSLFSPDILLKNKLKRLRLAIKAWSCEQVSAQNQAKETLLGRLLDWDVRAENGLLSDVDIAKREEWLMDLGHIEQLRRDDIRQKSRIKWAVEGDENTHFFHSILRNNYANYSIKGINVNGAWIDSPDDIKQASLDHFSARFKEEFMTRPSFTSSRFRMLSPDVAQALESKFSMDEVKDAVWNCAGSKAPGPDSFNFNFIKSHWEVLKFDFWNCVKHFELTGRLGNGCIASFVVLIPKKNDPLGFSDYRPISLIGCVYKIISKLLASRLARVIDSVIRPNQSAFIEGRQILDGCLIANEVIRMASLENQKQLLFKVDFEKAFDSVNWKFLLNVMRQMGFGLKWRKWIYSCLASASISIIINSSPTKEFKMERGLRQGDLLSPFLFLLVAEALQVTVLEACNVGLYNGVSLASNGANISLLQYANVVLFFGEWSRWNAKNLIHILKCFELGSGLKVNLAKSRILGVGVPINVV